MTVYVDGVSVGVGTASEESATDFATNMPVYVGDPWHPAAKVTLSDLSYTASGMPVGDSSR